MDSIQSVIKIETPEEREYARYLGEIESRKLQVAQTTAELESLRLAVLTFEAEYHSRVGPLFVELDRLNLSINEYELRMERLKRDTSADPSSIENEVSEVFHAEREEINRTEEEVFGYEEQFRADQQRATLEPDQEEHLKQLYRTLAKRFHPDLARTDEERRRRETVMQRINAAYAARNHQSLETIAQEHEFLDPEFDQRTTGERLVWAIREVARLDSLVTILESELAALKDSPAHRLWQRESAGERVIATLVVQLVAEIATAQQRLSELLSMYRAELQRFQA